MNGGDFIKRIRRLGQDRGVPVHFDESHGKGSHGRLHFGLRVTTVKDRRKDLSKGLLRTMLAQLGLSVDDIR